MVSLDSKSEPAESQTRSRGREKWRKESGWLFICCHHELRGQAREVLLEYSSILASETAGKDVSKAIRVPRSGMWVWKPDADRILELGQLASCRGPQQKIKRPFFTCQPSARALRIRPDGPPTF